MTPCITQTLIFHKMWVLFCEMCGLPHHHSADITKKIVQAHRIFDWKWIFDRQPPTWWSTPQNRCSQRLCPGRGMKELFIPPSKRTWFMIVVKVYYFGFFSFSLLVAPCTNNILNKLKLMFVGDECMRLMMTGVDTNFMHSTRNKSCIWLRWLAYSRYPKIVMLWLFFSPTTVPSVCSYKQYAWAPPQVIKKLSNLKNKIFL